MYESVACPQWFIDWVADYDTALGVGTDFADVMLRRWWPAFAASNYLASELNEVLQRLIAKPPERPRDHLPMVNTLVAEFRARRAIATVAPQRVGSSGACPLCRWSGAVIVPHPEDICEAEWCPPYRTGVVSCTRCVPGQRAYDAVCELANTGKIRHAPMTIDQYEVRVTQDWAAMMAEHEERERLMRRAQDHTEGLSSPKPRAISAKKAASIAGIGKPVG